MYVLNVHVRVQQMINMFKLFFNYVLTFCVANNHHVLKYMFNKLSLCFKVLFSKRRPFLKVNK